MLLALFSLLWTAESRAGLILVNTVSDAPSQDACRLRAAILAANTNTPREGCNAGSGDIDLIGFRDIAGEEIILNGTEMGITSNIQFLGDGVQINANGQGVIFLILDVEVFLQNMTLTSTGWDGSSQLLEPVVYVVGNEARLELFNVSIEGTSNGIFSGLSYPFEGFNDFTNPRVRINNSRISGNGVGVTTAGGSLNIIDSQIDNNDVGVLRYVAEQLDPSPIFFNVRRSSFTANDTALINEDVNVGNPDYVNDIPTISHSTFSGNLVAVSLASSIEVSNVTISGSQQTGVRINNDWRGNTVSLDQVTIIDSGQYGIRIDGDSLNNDGTIALGNSIVYNSGLADCLKISGTFDVPVNVAVRGINLVESLQAKNFGALGVRNCDWTGTGAVVQGMEPLLGPLQDNGGPTLTHLPLPGSPVIDSGDNAFAVGTDDQRGSGFDRIANGGTVDLGAVEVQSAIQAGPDFVVNTAADSRDGTCDPTPGDCSLFEAIEAANGDPGPSRINVSAKLVADEAMVLGISGGLPSITTPVNINGQGLSVDTIGNPFIIDPSGGSLGLEWLGVFTD
jgi:CSLREA domain-containing protein